MHWPCPRPLTPTPHRITHSAQQPPTWRGTVAGPLPRASMANRRCWCTTPTLMGTAGAAGIVGQAARDLRLDGMPLVACACWAGVLMGACSCSPACSCPSACLWCLWAGADPAAVTACTVVELVGAKTAGNGKPCSRSRVRVRPRRATIAQSRQASRMNAAKSTAPARVESSWLLSDTVTCPVEVDGRSNRQVMATAALGLMLPTVLVVCG